MQNRRGFLRWFSSLPVIGVGVLSSRESAGVPVGSVRFTPTKTLGLQYTQYVYPKIVGFQGYYTEPEARRIVGFKTLAGEDIASELMLPGKYKFIDRRDR